MGRNFRTSDPAAGASRLTATPCQVTQDAGVLVVSEQGSSSMQGHVLLTRTVGNTCYGFCNPS